MFRKTWRVIRSMVGVDAREFLALLCIALGLSRVLGWAERPTIAIRWVPSLDYGSLLCIVGVLLLATTKYRYGVFGRIIAICAVFVTISMAVDTWPYSTLVYAVMCLSAIGQSVTMLYHEARFDDLDN